MIRYPKKRRKKVKSFFGLYVFAYLLVLFALCVQNSNQNVKYKALTESLAEGSAKLISKAIFDVIRVFYIANNIKFDFIIYGEKSNHINDVINGIMNKLGKESPMNVILIPNITNWNHKLTQSAIIFIKSIDAARYLQKRSKGNNPLQIMIKNSGFGRLKFCLYVEDVKSISQFHNILDNFDSEEISLKGDLVFYEFFIVSNKINISLVVYQFFAPNKCRKSTLEVLNFMEIFSQEWNKELKNFNHYENFNDCFLNFQVQYGFGFYIYDDLRRFKKYLPLNFSNPENAKFAGLTYEIIEIMSKNYNFTPHYTLGVVQNSKLSTQNTKKFKVPLTFPFDTTTWILIFFIFGTTFVIIFGLQFCPQWIRIIIFGKGVNSPAYNALGIFFGISQLRFPEENFCRVILLIFILFCLIIRTCWQSMMFEFMTTDMRKPLPTLIEDFIEMNYTIVIENVKFIYYKEFLKNRKSPNLIILNETVQYSNLYEEALLEKSKIKYAFFVNEIEHASWNLTYKASLPVLENERLKKSIALSVFKNNILQHQMNEVIDRLIPMGILKFLSDYGRWYVNRPVDAEIEDPRKILSMNDLEFGFVIFLGALAFSIVVFICELLSLSMRRFLKNLFGLFEFLRVIREILKVYHNEW
ncbi:hypothetical protein PVAND_001427 [Polypedilum vanderplanki]|uniref:Ionotropic receptor n=1 Tax=Polypedilum vanderplanki TaxID=319348 RepID=A0A9J6BN68_POLVA|nr:hypothetical protein PVAND_001427 [Polypedilum vanderplanki]